MSELLGAPLVPSAPALASLLVRLALNLLFTLIAVRVIYSRLYRQRDYIFTYLIVNVVTFALAFLLTRAPIAVGSAFGLFAVFGILRYRTEAIAVRNLSYLFVVIGIALLNALANAQVAMAELVIVNAAIVTAVALLEGAGFSHREESRLVLYDRLELLAPERGAELLEDLRTRTRLPVERYAVGNVDLLRDTVDVTVYYRIAGRAHGPAGA